MVSLNRCLGRREAEAAYYLMGTELPDVLSLWPLLQTAP